MQITITRIARNNKTSSTGKPYVSVGIQCNEYGEKFINGFGNKDNANWKVGDTVDVDIETKGEYLNFSMPKTSQKGGTPPDINRLEAKIDLCLAEQRTLNATMTDIKGVLGTILQKLDIEEGGF